MLSAGAPIPTVVSGPADSLLDGKADTGQIAFADFNNDGFLDYISSKGTSILGPFAWHCCGNTQEDLQTQEALRVAGTKLFLGDGLGSFTLHQTFTLSRSLCVADFNQDVSQPVSIPPTSEFDRLAVLPTFPAERRTLLPSAG